ncbi:MAG: Rne/Rng family ribonuclease [Candidatus Omnitrophica bacterium]|nr:Rne/Rng family ribonuclease [Candidatus Omnitrophota bacterium]
MKREILISLEANEKRVAILENGQLEEFFIERADQKYMLGNIYKGTVRTIVPGIEAAFINIGSEKDGFLYVTDAVRNPLDAEEEPGEVEGDDEIEEVRKPARRQHHSRVKINELLKEGQEVIVQVVKEPIRTKGPRLTTFFSFPARYLVMMPGERRLGLSRRINEPKERERIRAIFNRMDIPEDVGFIVRTAAEGKADKEFERDIKYLLGIWSQLKKDINTKPAPSLIHEELDLVERIIRDSFTEETASIIVDDRHIFSSIQNFLKVYMPDEHVNLQMYHDRVPLFEKFNIEKEIEKTFQKNVYLKSGGHLVIEQTESLVAIDVNTGKFTGRHNLEETVYRTNCEAAREIARQLRLRDIGGIIIADFIDMEEEEHRRSVLRIFKDAVRRDRAKTNILKISELGLVEMTRQRVRPSHESALYQPCPHCGGKGVVKSVTTMLIQAIKQIRKALSDSKRKTLEVSVHPDVAERLLVQEKRIIKNFEHQYQSRIIIMANPALHVEDIRINIGKAPERMGGIMSIFGGKKKQ